MAARKQLVYSLFRRNKSKLSGPYCSSCLNGSQHIIRKMDDEGDLLIYLHTDKQPNQIFFLEKLEVNNGALHPFDLQDHPKDAAYLPCTHSGCTTNHNLEKHYPEDGLKQLEVCGETSMPKLPSRKSPTKTPPDVAKKPRNKIKDPPTKKSLVSPDEKQSQLYPPFYVRSQNIVKPLNLTEETMNDLKKAANNKKSLPLISKTVESRYPKAVKENLSITCGACELKLSGVSPVIQHILSPKHLNKVNSNGDAFDEGDLQTMKEIIAEATGQRKAPATPAKRMLFPTGVPTNLCSATVAVSHIPLGGDRCKSMASLSPPNSEKTSGKQKKKDDGRVPLFSGASHPSRGLAMREIPYFIRKANEEMSKYFLIPDLKKLKRACDANGWKEENCPFCPKDFKFKNDFPGHVLSQQHVNTMMSRGVYPLQEDYLVLTELLTEIKFCADEKRRLSLPFFYGSPEEAQQVNETKLFVFLEKYRAKIQQHPLEVVEMILEKEYKRPANCTFCDATLEGAGRLFHIMSSQHIKKVLQARRYFTSWDVHNMRKLDERIQQSAEINKSWSTPAASPYSKVW